MPVLDFTCSCGNRLTDVLVQAGGKGPVCPKCDLPMVWFPTAPPMVKIKGEGGYPSRRRQIFNTTNRIHPKLD